MLIVSGWWFDGIVGKGLRDMNTSLIGLRTDTDKQSPRPPINNAIDKAFRNISTCLFCLFTSLCFWVAHVLTYLYVHFYCHLRATAVPIVILMEHSSIVMLPHNELNLQVI